MLRTEGRPSTANPTVPVYFRFSYTPPFLCIFVFRIFTHTPVRIQAALRAEKLCGCLEIQRDVQVELKEDLAFNRSQSIDNNPI